MRICPQCGRRYSQDTVYCAKDGVRLTHADNDVDSVDRSHAPEPGSVLGSYRLIRLLAEGGMGRVYLAEHTSLSRKVALKILRSDQASNPTAIRRFFQEARAVNKIQHENIVQITDFVEEPGGDNYCIMELLQGLSLAQLMLKEGRPLPIDRILHIMDQVCNALHAAHQAGIVHRDMKPDNIFLTEVSGSKDFVKLLDFGVAKLLDSNTDRPLHQTAAGAILGTPEYMSPEQAGGLQVGVQSDVYSIGIILFEMITGKKPFQAASYGEMVIKHITIPPPRPSEFENLPHAVPENLENLVLQCLEKDPEKRPQGMLEIKRHLAALDRSGFSIGQVIVDKPSIFTRRTVFISAAVVVLAVLVILGMRALVKDEAPFQKIDDLGFLSEPLTTTQPDDTILSWEKNKVQIVFESRPEGARVYQVGQTRSLGTTPFTMVSERVDQSRSFEFRLQDYHTSTRVASLQKDERIVVVLKKIKPTPKPVGRNKTKLSKKPKTGAGGKKPDKPVLKKTKKLIDRGGTLNPFEEE